VGAARGQRQRTRVVLLTRLCGLGF
jgi:hypothetical protein